MKVLYFSRDYTPHDHRFLFSLAAAVGVQVYFLRLEKRGHVQEDRLLPPQVRLVSWEGGQEAYDHHNHRTLLAGLKKVIRQVKPDIIHAGPVQTAAWLAAQTRFHPLVTMSWGSDLLRDADSSGQMRRLTQFTLDQTDVLVGDCQAVADKAASFGFPAERVVTFPWGVDLDTFSPGEAHGGLRERAGWQEDFVLLHLRSWEPVYGVEVFARAFARAARQRSDLRLYLLGKGSLAPEIRRILMPMLDQVRFEGQVSQDKLPAYYQAADLYISASHSDGSSVSLMEALASGLPALVSDIPGNSEWIAGSGAGWLFPDGDADALADAILRAAEDREALRQAGVQARALAEERADWDQNFARLLDAYHLAIELEKRA
jgi:glycosyltransferase involved in cell wall biosynthesis